MRNKPLVLIILDGWGIATEGTGNAISLANTPFWNRISVAYPHTSLLAAGESVGLPGGEEGNSEVGHLNIGAGMIVYQEMPRINMAISDGSFIKKEAFLLAADHTNKNKSSLHIMGLVSRGNVHSSLEHLYALLWFAKSKGMKDVFIHAFTDGRDSPPTSGLEVIEEVLQKCSEIGLGRLASVCGRYFAMDRDERWDRTNKAYNLLTSGEGERTENILLAIGASYKSGKTDEFIEPIIIEEQDKSTHTIKDDDSVIFLNFRPDRARQLTHAFVDKDFTKFSRPKKLENISFVTMTEYQKNLPVLSAFPPLAIDYPLAAVLAMNDVHQLHIGETEKYAHVTYFLNGGNERPFPGEDRMHIPSPKVATYDKQPEMSAPEIANYVIKKLEEKMYGVYVINFANADMVAHTGSIKATTKAIEVLDSSVEKISNAVLSYGGVVVITGDHGNAESMINPTTGRPNTKHTANPVPFIVVADKFNERQSLQLPSGILADVAPTILYILDIPKPDSMTGKNLLGD